jgi:hypothetical protein
VTAELAARITAARAVLGDYQGAATDEGADVTDRALWGTRVADALASLLDALGSQTDPFGAPARAEQQLGAIRDLLAHFDWEFHDRQLALEEIDRIAGSGP